MRLISWDDCYSVGNEELDNQHINLFNIINTLYEMCFKYEHVYLFNSVIDELANYTDYHFSIEEQCMEDIGYIDIDKHILKHSYFIKYILKLKQMNIESVSESTKLLIANLGNWLLHHVIEEDKKIPY